MKSNIQKNKNKKFTFWSIGKIIRIAGLGYLTVVYVLLFCLCAALITITNPAFANYGDSLWLCFQSITTIGFGDMPTADVLTRIIIVFLSIVSVFFLAIITGVVVAFINQIIKERVKNGELTILHKLEHLDQLSNKELKELSEEIRSKHQG